MIGGAMLACAVGAMVLIAWWSLNNDDVAERSTGLLALRSWSERVIARKHDTVNSRNRRPEAKAPTDKTRRRAPQKTAQRASGKRDRRPDPTTTRRRR